MEKFLVATMAIIMIVTISAAGQNSRTRVVFFGDSITELGVRENGYVTRIAGLAKAAGKDDKYEFIGAGVSGNKIYDLYLRAETDVIARSPNIVVIFVGVNDVWHKRLLGTGTDLDKFGKFYSALVTRLQNAKAKVVVCTPAVIGERKNFTNEMDGELNLYSEWIKKFAAENHLPLVDLRKVFVEYEEKNNADDKPSGILTTDKVHLNPKGNEVVADAIWKVVSGM
ncbi:MAG: SGNH/GDSL hydrolase family protein [Acidobacteriota bacterium]